jgi:hypothetical protein
MMVVNQLETLAGAVTPEDFHSHPRDRSLISHPSIALKVKFCKARRSNAPSHRTEAFRRGTIASVVVAIRKHTFYFRYPPERDASAQICFFHSRPPFPLLLPLNSSLNTAARTRTRSSLGVMLSPAAAAPLLDIIYIPHSVSSAQAR